MDLRPLDIVAAQVSVKNCNDIRPCIVVYPPSGGIVSVALMSSQLGMFDENSHFMIEQDDPNFKATGLDRTSYASLGLVKIRLEQIKKNMADSSRHSQNDSSTGTAYNRTLAISFEYSPFDPDASFGNFSRRKPTIESVSVIASAWAVIFWHSS